MDDSRERIFPLGTILVLGGFVLLLAVAGGAIGFLIGVFSNEVARIDAAGTTTIQAPSDARYIVTRPDEENPSGGAEVSVGVTNTGRPAASDTFEFGLVDGEDLRRANEGAYLTLGEQRYGILGSIDLAAGANRVEVAGEAADFPLIVFASPELVLREAGIYAAAAAVLPIGMIVVGVVVCIRNKNRRMRFELDAMDALGWVAGEDHAGPGRS